MQPTRLRGARTHNLQNIDLTLSPGTLTAIVGPSGAGKSSLAFATLYAEGQRRYVESFSAYARQFLERLPRPPVDELDPVPPGIAVDRQGPVRTSRSTVGTMTEVADYAKSLWARLSRPHCPTAGFAIERDTPEAAARRLLESHPGARVTVLYPVPVTNTEEFLGVREALLADGYRRILSTRAGKSEVVDLDAVRPSEVLHKRQKQGRGRPAELCTLPPASPSLDVVADRLVVRREEQARLVEALSVALSRGQGRAEVLVDGGERLRLSTGLSCARCERRFRDPSPGMFSWNSPVGACDRCRGFGRVITLDIDKVIPDRTKSIAQGAIAAFRGRATQWEQRVLKRHAKGAGVPLDVPIAKLKKRQLQWLLHGDEDGWPDGWGGLYPWFEWLEGRAYKMHIRIFLSRFRKYEVCPSCAGDRLKPESLLYRLDGLNLAEFMRLSASEALERVAAWSTLHADDPASALLLSELDGRLRALCDVGLGYLALDRQSRTLSGGEAQRVSLTGALGSALTGAMFVLDEPTVGLHPADVERLSRVVRRLTHGGNQVIVVEHDLDVIQSVDRVVELGPAAGAGGGRIVFDGPPSELAAAATLTGRALAAPAIATRETRLARGELTLRGARGHNLAGVDARIPLGVMTCVTGVSGSGKSSLILETLVPALQRELGLSSDNAPLAHDALERKGAVSDVVHVDQAPLGRTSRGNPGTYMKAWDVVRRRFAAEPIARERDYGPGFFSSNVTGGRCEVCKGQGYETVEMQFLADVTFSCPACQGKRFVGPVLEVRHRGLDVSEVLELTVDRALSHFAEDGELCARLAPLREVGLGYLALGQPLNTLSGGESQRLKLALSLAQSRPGALLVLDEPTAGLHPQDVVPLLAALDRLIARGDSVVVVEHDMRIAAHSDWVIDLGPGAGDQGGRIIAQGTPRTVARDAASRTAPFLARALGLPAARAPESTAPRSLPPEPEANAAIEVRGAREHNLRDIALTIPRERLVVITGPSGSGKSTLAFDIIYAEGQRRFLETLAPYARQYMPQLPRPEVDRVAGVPPTVSLEQRMTTGGGNSTVATVTEVAHFLRLLYARIGAARGTGDTTTASARGRSDLVEPEVLASQLRKRFGPRARLRIYAPVVQGRKGFHRELLDKARRDGFTQARIDGDARELTEGLSLERHREHDIDLLVAALRAGERDALCAAIRTAAGRAERAVRVVGKAGEVLAHVGEGQLLEHGSRPLLDPRLFSFNTRHGACPRCEGQGVLVHTVGRGKRAREERSTCPACEGTRLCDLARSIEVTGQPITHYLSMSIDRARDAIAALRLSGRDARIGQPVVSELLRRLDFLIEVGVGYLGLDRTADTLSGGETQRVRLSAQLGSGLTGVLYVLDEPTIGLHPRDTRRLIAALRSLVDKGNSVLVVEHDIDTIRAADHVIDFGPGGGVHGGRVVAAGSPAELVRDPHSVTGRALGRATRLPDKRRSLTDCGWLAVRGARQHNLSGIDVRFPLTRLSAVTGVSGSGKSTLVRRVLLPAVRTKLGLSSDPPGKFSSISGTGALERAVEVDQSPIGRTPRSVPATYVGIWDELRRLLAATPEARARGYSASRFSFNTVDGRCPECEGQGALTAQMAFLPDVTTPCESCRGMRFTDETLAVRLHGLHAGEILDLSVEQAAEIFAAVPNVARPLGLLAELGLGYLHLGQASNTLSGGEAQRLKLVAELGTAARGRTLYVLDEPTTGLHRDDVARLSDVLSRFVERGDTVVVIEHNPDLIASADWIVDLGPEGGDRGGSLVVEGTPEQVAAHPDSRTGAVLRAELAPGQNVAARAARRVRTGAAPNSSR